MNASTRWQESYNQHLINAIVIGGAISSLIFVMLSRYLPIPYFFVYLGVFILWIVITYTVFNYGDGFKKSCTYKFFLTEEKIAKKVVENVLNSKNLPYTTTDQGFILDSIEIRIGTGAINRGATRGAIIALAPYQGSNQPIIASLTKKIDEAFLPQGLNQ